MWTLILRKLKNSAQYHITSMQQQQDSELSLLSTVLISYCCCNKLAKTWYLTLIHLYYLTIIIGDKSKMCLTGMKSRCQQGCISSGDCIRQSIYLSQSISRDLNSMAHWLPSFIFKTSSTLLILHHFDLLCFQTPPTETIIMITLCPLNNSQ